MVRIFLKAIVIAGMLLFPLTSAQAVEVGQPAPAFQLSDTQGQVHSLADFQGKYVVLEWINHDCPFVKKHYDSGNMQKLQEKYTGQGVIWLSINSSAMEKEGSVTPEQANQLTEAKDAHPTAVLLDLDGTVGKAYDAKTTPHMYIINPDGILIYQGAIDDKPSVDVADIESATNYVAAGLDQAMAGTALTTTSTKSYGCSVKY